VLPKIPAAWSRSAARLSLAEGYFNVGVIAAYFDEQDKEIEAYLKAIELQPNYLPAHINLGLAYKARGEWEEALRYLRHALQIMPDDTFVLFHMGEIYVNTQNVSKAEEIYSELVKLEPQSAQELRIIIDKSGTPSR